MKKTLSVAVGVLLMLLQPVATAAATKYPERPITIVVPYAPGGVTDLLSRYLAAEMSKRLGQQAIVQNQPGGGGAVGANSVANNKPDGYTLLISIESLTIGPVLHPDTHLDPLTELAPVSLLATAPQLIVATPDFGPDTVQELVTLAKEKPNEIAYASSGTGTALHLGMEQLQSMAGIELRHIPYKGGGQSIFALLAGQVQLGTIGVAPVLQHLQSGKLKALAITKPTRSELLPDIPTVAESGLPGFSSLNWFGMFAPKGTPDEILDLLGRELREILRDPAAATHFSKYGVDIVVSDNVSEFQDFLRADLEKWKTIAEQNDIQVD